MIHSFGVTCIIVWDKSVPSIHIVDYMNSKKNYTHLHEVDRLCHQMEEYRVRPRINPCRINIFISNYHRLNRKTWTKRSTFKRNKDFPICCSALWKYTNMWPSVIHSSFLDLWCCIMSWIWWYSIHWNNLWHKWKDKKETSYGIQTLD